MLNYFFPTIFLIFGIFSILLSKSQNNYGKLVENNGVGFANRITRILNIGGFLLVFCACIWIAILVLN